jgi:hypothetical protein
MLGLTIRVLSATVLIVVGVFDVMAIIYWCAAGFVLYGLLGFIALIVIVTLILMIMGVDY